MMSVYREETRAYVADFVKDFRLFSSSIVAAFPQLSSLSDIVREVRSGRLLRRDSISGGLQYQVHGRGCVMIGADGEIINVDFLVDGRAIFDVTRLEDFVRSTDPDDPVSRMELLEVCRLAVAEGHVVEAEDGWFIVPDLVHSERG